MDPTATLRALTDACLDGDRIAATDALEFLTEWLAKGGFLPVPTECHFCHQGTIRTGDYCSSCGAY